MARQRIDANGHYLTDDGTPVQFLPEIPGASPVYDLVHPAVADPDSPDGHRHYLIGGDPDVVAEIVAWYKAAGHPVPDGYADHAARHAAKVANGGQDPEPAEAAAPEPPAPPTS